MTRRENFAHSEYDENSIQTVRFFLIVFSVCFLIILLASTPLHAQVTINEIMFNPEGLDYHTEYIELYNLGSPVFLYGWRISDGESFDYLLRAPDSSSITLESNSYAIILDSEYWEDEIGLYDELIPPGTLVLTIEDNAFGDLGLSNSVGETVQLVDDNGNVVSERTYIPNDVGGLSEERIRVDGDESDDNWAFSDPGGTPGFYNSASPLPDDLAVDSLTVEYDQHQDHFELNAACIVENVGAETSSARELFMYIGTVIEFPDSLLSSTHISPSSPGMTQIIPLQATVPIDEGDYRAMVVLSPFDDNAVNDTTFTNFTLIYEQDPPDPPDPAETWPTITEIMASPPPSPLSIEWLELRLDADEPLSMSGWSIQDAAGSSARFPDDSPTILPESLYVFAESIDALNWTGLRADQLIVADSWFSLNNDGDTICLIDPNGFTVDSVSYPDAEAEMSLILHELPDDSFEWYPHVYEPFASPGLDNEATFPPSELQIDSVSTYILTGFEGTSDSLAVDFDIKAEGWFIDQEIAWTILIPWGIDFRSIAHGILSMPAPSESAWQSTVIPTSEISHDAGWQTFDISLGFDNPDYNQPSKEFTAFIPASNDDHPHSHLVVQPNPFSPDGDGFEDTVTFQFNLPADEILITVRIFDSIGRPLGTISRDVRIPGKGDWSWNGRTGLSSDNSLPLGLYAYVADITSLDGDQTWRVKGALASAGGR
jgi:Lamin Tail Domain